MGRAYTPPQVRYHLPSPTDRQFPVQNLASDSLHSAGRPQRTQIRRLDSRSSRHHDDVNYDVCTARSNRWMGPMTDYSALTWSKHDMKVLGNAYACQFPERACCENWQSHLLILSPACSRSTSLQHMSSRALDLTRSKVSVFFSQPSAHKL